MLTDFNSLMKLQCFKLKLSSLKDYKFIHLGKILVYQPFCHSDYLKEREINSLGTNLRVKLVKFIKSRHAFPKIIVK